MKNKKRYVTAAVIGPNDAETTLNEYTKMGWHFQNVVSFSNGKIMFIFAREDEKWWKLKWMKKI